MQMLRGDLDIYYYRDGTMAWDTCDNLSDITPKYYVLGLQVTRLLSQG